ncbi:MAG: VanZ family protein [Sideroxydans sp.]|nr:VanZ family protein [Sideroxydans sp.]
MTHAHSPHSLPPRRSLLRHYLLAGHILFLIYVSLSPFEGWQEQGVNLSDVLAAPFGQTYTAFDAIVNVLAYVPLGLLLMLTLRVYFGALRSALLAVLGAFTLSLSLEFLQLYLPARTSSNVDMLTNTVGALVGALLALYIARHTLFARLTRWRMHLFQRASGVDFGLALVMLWMFAQINPSLPMLGNVFLTESAHRIFAAMPEQPFNGWESVAVTLNLLMIGLLLQTVLHVRSQASIALLLVLCAVGLAKFLAAALLLKSWALLLWLNGEAMLGIVAGLLIMWSASRLRGRALFALGMGVIMAYLVLAFGVLDSGTPAAAQSLSQWRYGHVRNYNSLSQTVSLLFPVLLGAYLMRVRRRI